MNTTRRTFIQTLLSLPVLGCVAQPRVWATPAQQRDPKQKVLVLLELKGGNDGLNTIVPFADRHYYALRPKLAVPREQTIPIDDHIGFHASLAALQPLWQRQQMALVLGVGYPQANLSHFRSIDIWNTGSASDEYLDDGWFTRLFSRNRFAAPLLADGVVIDQDAGPLAGTKRMLVLTQPEKFLKRAGRLHLLSNVDKPAALSHVIGTHNRIVDSARDLVSYFSAHVDTPVDYPKSGLARQLKLAAKIISAEVPVAVIKISLGGFDTHVAQRNRHTRLLTQLSEAVAAFALDLQKSGHWHRTLLMSYSEFGRRAAENANAGTDHGTAAPLFLLGGNVKGGIYGRQPSLHDLEDGNLRYQIDFRAVYQSVARYWWGFRQMPGRDMPLLNILS